MNTFKDKKVCLVLSCNRPYYIKRRNEHMDTFDFFRENGYIVVYLLGNAPNYELTLEPLRKDEYNLYVPIMECYEMLSPKIEIAYKYLYDNGCDGVLKLDDDIRILDKILVKDTVLNIINKYDYGGISNATFGNLVQPVSLHKYTINYFKTLYTHCKSQNFRYFGGPLYWISKLALKQVCNIGILYFYEDVSIGYAVSKNPSLTIFENPNNLFYNTAFSVDEQTEV